MKGTYHLKSEHDEKEIYEEQTHEIGRKLETS